MQVTILGTGSGGPFQGRHYTAQVVHVDQHLFLIDCGEGTQMQLFRSKIKYDRFGQIFISHLHGDHVYGLAGLLTSYALKQRTEPVTLFGPQGLQDLIGDQIRHSLTRIPYPLHFVTVDTTTHQMVFENKAVEVWSVPLNHRVPCNGWLFREKAHLRNMIKEKIDTYGIPWEAIPAIKAGADYQHPDGRVVPNAELSTPPRSPRSYAFCSDTAPSMDVVKAVKSVDLLYHEATFSNEHLAEAEMTGHSTAAQAAEVAREANVGTLVLGHFSGRYKDVEVLLAEAQAVFPNTFLSEDGMMLQVGGTNPG
ncbi:MAG: ribonuclease Z [Saprospiraceae bacterium]|nr:ribonuclease Z [Saprospiraceae bacterium]